MSERRSDHSTGDVTFLEMTSPEQLQPASESLLSLDLEEIDPSAAPVVRATYVRIGTPLSWSGRMGWSEEEWRDELSRPEVRAWIARTKGEVAGLAELDIDPNGDVGIVIFGLVPEFVGIGLGGEFLTTVTRLAWTAMADAPKRVVVQTSADDHPHALPNYRARGFRVIDARHEPAHSPPKQG